MAVQLLQSPRWVGRVYWVSTPPQDRLPDHLHPSSDAVEPVLLDELEWLTPFARDSWLVGFSGGATQGLALAATSLPMLGCLLHEPAVGSLVPGLLAPVADAYATDGYRGIGRPYGASWRPEMAPETGGTVARALPMFRAFEPQRIDGSRTDVQVSVGQLSPPSRQAASSALQTVLGYPATTSSASSHFAPFDNAPEFAAAIKRLVSVPGGSQ